MKKEEKQHSSRCATKNVNDPIEVLHECDCDGYHTFTELYDHRITLFITLCRHIHELLSIEAPEKFKIWRSKLHADGTSFYGWFILGIGTGKGKQITYHLPLSSWGETDFVETLDRAPEWDGHTPKDVLERLNNL